MVKNDSFLNTQYVALWPKLPGFVKSRLKRPNTAAEIRVKAVGALRQMRSPFTDSEMGLAALTSHDENSVIAEAIRLLKKNFTEDLFCYHGCLSVCLYNSRSLWNIRK